MGRTGGLARDQGVVDEVDGDIGRTRQVMIGGSKGKERSAIDVYFVNSFNIQHNLLGR